MLTNVNVVFGVTHVGPEDKGGDLYDSSMGDDVSGGSVRFDDDKTHHTVHGDGWHRSWDDNGDNDHTTIHWEDGNEVLDD